MELDVTMPGLSKVAAQRATRRNSYRGVGFLRRLTPMVQGDAQKIVDAAHEICP